MVCPITNASSDQLKIYLPSGINWIDFWSGKAIEGGKTINEKVTMDHIPLYVKQGAIIPMNFSSNDDVSGQPLELRIYPGNNGSFMFYEDANDGLGYKNEQYSKIWIEYTEKNKTVTIWNVEGEYPGMPAELKFNIVLVSENDGVGTEPSTTAQEVLFKGKKIKVKFE